jgi:hypothetical protein
MHKTTLFIIAFFFSCQLLAQQGWTDKTRLLPDTLRTLPHGISIWHHPNPVFPIWENDRYVWKHNTQVRAEIADLEVVLAGSFIWYSEQGWIPNIELNRTEFAQLFSCSKGKLKKGKTYTYTENYRFGQQAYGGDALWFVLAKDASGNYYKGIGLVETEPASRTAESNTH